MASEKKGSKLFRRILTKTPKKVVEKNLKQMSQVKTFFRLTETNELKIIRIKSMLVAWNNFFYKEQSELSCLNFIITRWELIQE